MQLTIDTIEKDPARTMFLRQEIARGTDDKTGNTVEVSISGATIVLEHQRPKTEGAPFGAGRTLHTISLTTLIQQWAKQVEMLDG